MKAVYPALTAANVDALLQNGDITNAAGAAGRDDVYGNGIINAYKAVRAAQQLANGGNPPQPEPSIVATPSSISFGQTSQIDINIDNQGGGNPVVTAVQGNASWLTITPTTVDASSFGVYRLSVNRSGLGDGYYQANVSVEVDGTAALNILVTMQVGAAASSGRVATQYVLLTNPETLQPLAEVRAVDNGSGTVAFQFNDVAPGTYALISGSDIDNDSVVCQSGESCGTYPSMGEASTVTVQDSNITGINITVDILGSLNAAAAHSGNNVQREPGFRRLATEMPSSTTPDKQIAQ
jgi:serine protease